MVFPLYESKYSRRPLWPVEFSIRTSDLRRAIEQLKVNRGKYNDSDFVDIVITDSAARFTAVGTESEEPVEGKHLGSLRMPLKLVDTISEQLGTFKKSTVPFKCSPGVIKIESWTIRNEAIELNPKLERGDKPANRSLNAGHISAQHATHGERTRTRRARDQSTRCEADARFCGSAGRQALGAIRGLRKRVARLAGNTCRGCGSPAREVRSLI